MHLKRPLTVALFAVIALAGTATAFAQERRVPTAAELRLSYAPVVQHVAPAVVNVYAAKVVQNRQPLFDDPIFRRFFGVPGGGDRPQVQRSLGSGVIVDASGLVVTNVHVIEGADEVKVSLADKREFEAEIVLKDKRSDLAVLRIKDAHERFPTLEFANSDALEVGDVVLAIGDPFGVGQTVTMGIVSALARTAIGASDYRFFIQTDAAINPGNSGGALIDVQGRLVGINSAIYTQSGGSVGIGFAIPVNMVKAVVAGIVSGGKAARPWLGAGGQAVSADMFASLHLARPTGMLVNSVGAGSPAAAAGIKVGDVITQVDGHEIDDPEALRYRIATRPVGSTVRLTLMRAGHETDVEAKLTAPPDVPLQQRTYIELSVPLQGATVANLNPALAEEIGFEGTPQGVIVIAVRPGTVAARLEIRPGDRIVRVNGATIDSVDGLAASLREKHDRWQFTIGREGQVLTMTIGGE